MIQWTEQAIRQLDQVYEHIALSNSQEAAARVTKHIISSIEQLNTFPMSGRTGRISDTRELVISDTPFIVAYALPDKDNRIVILAIYHGAQRWPGQL
ncbi:MAG TPA: type II toxin-antitoxin system RelE/ParE family toxin [Terriglobales bacterium]|nr:type II toxin-antitoxin system RelE/ParE family toxin [Terriglobales bacterium]